MIKLKGWTDASKVTTYMVIVQNNEKYVVIDTFKDSFVVAQYDQNTRKITPKYKFIEVKSVNKDALELTNTGKLKVSSPK